MNTYAELIKTRRKELGLTQRALAKATDLHFQFISRIERGRSVPSVESLSRILTALELSETIGKNSPAVHQLTSGVLRAIATVFKSTKGKTIAAAGQVSDTEVQIYFTDGTGICFWSEDEQLHSCAASEYLPLLLEAGQ